MATTEIPPKFDAEPYLAAFFLAVMLVWCVLAAVLYEAHVKQRKLEWCEGVVANYMRTPIRDGETDQYLWERYGDNGAPSTYLTALACLNRYLDTHGYRR